MGYADLLGKALRDQPELEKYVHQIHRAAERSAELTKKLLAFSQQKGGVETIVNINTLLREEQHMLEKTLTARIKLVFNLADNLWLISSDSGDLEDAIINLSINAMHATEGNGQLTIQTENVKLDIQDAAFLNLTPGEYVLLSMTDTGSGIDAETKEKIFDPFFTTKGEQGTGLGLSQVYGFVARCGGAIKIYSELGQGSRFVLYFPRSHAPNIDREPGLPHEKQNPRGSETLLIVDDETDLADLAKNVLSAQGYRVLTANDGEQALAILGKEAVDLIVSDVIMPNMSGYELVSQVQQLYPHIKIQMASGFADDKGSSLIDDKLHQNMLLKPYRSEELLKCVRNLLDHE